MFGDTGFFWRANFCKVNLKIINCKYFKERHTLTRFPFCSTLFWASELIKTIEISNYLRVWSNFGCRLQQLSKILALELSFSIIITRSLLFSSDSQPISYKNLLWLPVNPKESKLTYLQIDTDAELVDDPFKERVEFWESLAIPG